MTEAAKLKQQGGNALVIYGHGLLGQTLLEGHLLDELKLWIHPIHSGGPRTASLSGRQTNETEARGD